MGMGKVNAVERELINFFIEWELGFCILLSLFLQILLILAGPLRRIVSRKWLDILLWSAYLLADGTAIFALGIISSRQIYYSKHHLNVPTSSILHTFWAPFLLAHLGGPDPITALALEDNELWLRHLFNFFTQCIAVAYVFYQFLTPNKLLAPSLLMFLCGIIKYAERTYALYCASANTFRDSILREPDPESAEFMREYLSKNVAIFREPMDPLQGPDRVIEDLKRMAESKSTNLKPLEVVQYAFRYFSHFKGLVVDLIFSFYQRSESQEFFLQRSSNDAFRVVEVELNFLYDVLFTKLPAVYYQVGFGCRAVSVGAIVTSLVFFHYADKKKFTPQGFEVGITYTLLIGGILLEVIAFFMLVFSDWTVVKLEPSPDENPNEQSWKEMFIDFILSANVRRGKVLRWLQSIGGVRGTGKDSVSNPRWAESISGYNFIYYCLHRRSEAKEKIYEKIGIRAFLDGMLYVKQRPLPWNIKDFIFQELKKKSVKAFDVDSARKICSSKGEWVLENEGYINSYLFRCANVAEYDESLLVWHIATEICFNVKEIEGEHAQEQDQVSEHAHHRSMAKLISDYMIYLLVMKPDMMSAVSRIGLIRFRRTCDVAKHHLDKTISTKERLAPEMELQKIACQNLFQPKYFNDTNVNYEYKGTRAWITLDRAERLVQELKKIVPVEKRWEILSKVWVELLSYGASHIKPHAHAQQLSKGGELITVVWLLMIHLGLGDHFQPRILFYQRREADKTGIQQPYSFDYVSLIVLHVISQIFCFNSILMATS